MNKLKLSMLFLAMSTAGGCYAMDDGFDGMNNGHHENMLAEAVQALQNFWKSAPRIDEIEDTVKSVTAPIREKQREWEKPYRKTGSPPAEKPVVETVTTPLVQETAPSVAQPSDTITTPPANPPVVLESVQEPNTGFFNVSRNTLITSGVALAALVGITYVLHKKGILKKFKQKIKEHTRVAAGVTAGLTAIGAGTYYCCA